MSDDGWVKIYRQILESSIFQNSKTLHLALYCILKANHKTTKIIFNKNEFEILRGQFITGLKTIKKETKLSTREIRNSLQTLEQISFITRKTTNKFSIITVVKYSDFQSEEEKRANKGQAKDKQRTNQGQTKGNKQECKELKNDKNEKQSQTLVGLDLNSGFDSNGNKLIKRCRKNEKTFCDDARVFQISQKLQAKIQAFRPNQKNNFDQKKDLKIISAMIAIDKRDPDEILKLLDWYPMGQEYIPEIFSAKALREKYDKLERAKLRAENKSSRKDPDEPDYPVLQPIFQRLHNNPLLPIVRIIPEQEENENEKNENVG